MSLVCHSEMPNTLNWLCLHLSTNPGTPKAHEEMVTSYILKECINNHKSIVTALMVTLLHW